MQMRCTAKAAAFGIFVSLSLTVSATASETVRNTYDAKGRLTNVDGSNSGSGSRVYSFDKADNRTRMQNTGAGATVLNGDAENPAVSNYAYNPSAPDLVFYGGAGIAQNGGAWGFPAPWSGNQVFFIQASGNTAGYVEMKAVRLTVGQRYQFAFASAQRPGFPANNMKIYIDGNLVWDAPPDTADRFTPHPTQSFIASKDTATIRFAATPTSYDSSSAVDAVSVQPLN
ncbi:hypothetical protein BW41_00643 [Sphingomonas sp. RIT328]|nr:hypothetical protein BW41_00643 [Sphingomonas sp. RIT328]